MKKLLYFDRLKALQFKSKTSANSGLHIAVLDYDWPKDNRKCPKPTISSKMMTEILYGNLKEVFSNEKKWLQKRSSSTEAPSAISAFSKTHL